MKVHLKRTGGIAGICQEWKVDTSMIPPDKQLELKTLLEVARFFFLPSEINPDPGVRDAFYYEMSVECAEKTQNICFSDSTASEIMQKVIVWIQKQHNLEIRIRTVQRDEIKRTLMQRGINL